MKDTRGKKGQAIYKNTNCEVDNFTWIFSWMKGCEQLQNAELYEKIELLVNFCRRQEAESEYNTDIKQLGRLFGCLCDNANISALIRYQ